MKGLLRTGVFLLGFALVASSVASAGAIAGYGWFVDRGTGCGAPQATGCNGLGWAPTWANAQVLLAVTPDVVFTVDQIDFYTDHNDTLQYFLDSSGASVISSTPGSLAAGLNHADVNAVGGYKEFFMLLAGGGYWENGRTFSVTHDDGYSLYVGNPSGWVWSHPQPTATPPVTDTFTYTGPTGFYSWYLTYGEVNLAPGVLQADIPVPEPTSLLLLGTGLIGVARAWRKRRD